MKRELYQWQKKAIELFREATAFMLNACMGSGKTLTAIQIALCKKLPVIVIAPKNLCDTWQEELQENGVDEKDVWVYNQPTYSKNKAKYEREFDLWLRS